MPPFSRPASVALAAVVLLAAPARAAPDSDAALRARVEKVLAATPLIDGHNDLPWEIRTRYASKLSAIDLSKDTAHLPPTAGEGIALPWAANTPPPAPLMTDLPRLRSGRVGGQFWSVWIPVETQGPRAVEMTLEQIDLVKRMAARYPADFEMAYTAADVRRIHAAGRIACLIGIEGGHQIDASLPVLRQMYAAGARYMTLAHFTDTPWADSATDAPVHGGLTPFGKVVVREMNRLGMLVDLSHVSAKTMKDALAASRAPVIFSHSGAFALDHSPRNVPDDVLALVAKNGGVVMANFYPGYVSEAVRQWNAEDAAETARQKALHVGDPKAAAEVAERWRAAHPVPHATLAQVADHIEHIRQVAGIDHVGLGSDFDGIESTPDGLDGVDKYPALLIELARRGWSDQDLGKLAGGNILRVMAEAEATAKRLQASEPASEATLAELDGAAGR
jgi:membrane dipeptidase